MRETFLFLHRSTDQRFVFERDREGRLCGIPTKAWCAALLDLRAKNLLGFLSAEDRIDVWQMLEDETCTRALNRLQLRNAPLDEDNPNPNVPLAEDPPKQRTSTCRTEPPCPPSQRHPHARRPEPVRSCNGNSNAN